MDSFEFDIDRALDELEKSEKLDASAKNSKIILLFIFGFIVLLKRNLVNYIFF